MPLFTGMLLLVWVIVVCLAIFLAIFGMFYESRSYKGGILFFRRTKKKKEIHIIKCYRCEENKEARSSDATHCYRCFAIIDHEMIHKQRHKSTPVDKYFWSTPQERNDEIMTDLKKRYS